MKIIDRLHQYIETKGISLNAFDKSIGASNAYIGKQIKSGASIGGDVIEKIACAYTDLNINWLVTGQGSMFKSYGQKTDLKPTIVNEAGYDYTKCSICYEKDKRIEALEKLINTQQVLIDCLKNLTGENPEPKKRNAS